MFFILLCTYFLVLFKIIEKKIFLCYILIINFCNNNGGLIMKKNEKNLKHESKHSQTSKNLSKKVLCIIVLIVLLFLIIFFKDNFVNLFIL